MLQESNTGIGILSKRQQKLLATIRKLVEQQSKMYQTKTHRVEDRIVNLYQPHVRPIVRGKAGAAVEFGAKVAISLENGYSRIEKLSWDPFNEAGTLIESIEHYKERNAVEGKFGEGKRKYGLSRIAAKLKETAESMIALQFLVMNLEHKLRVLFTQILYWIFGQENRVILVG